MAVSAVTAGVGLYSANKADKQAKRQEAIQRDAQNRRVDLEEQALAFRQEQYSRWESIYGSIEENLGQYYNTLDSEEYKVQALQAEKIHFQDTQAAIKKQFGTANLGDNAAEQLALAGSTVNSARNRANIELNADEVIAQRQLGFVNSGRNVQTQAAAGVGNALAGSANFANADSVQAGNLARTYDDRREAAIGGVIGVGLDTAQDFKGSIADLWKGLGV